MGFLLHLCYLFKLQVLSINFDPHIKDRERQSVTRKNIYDNNVVSLRLPADIFVQHFKRVMEVTFIIQMSFCFEHLALFWSPYVKINIIVFNFGKGITLKFLIIVFTAWAFGNVEKLPPTT